MVGDGSVGSDGEVSEGLASAVIGAVSVTTFECTTRSTLRGW